MRNSPMYREEWRERAPVHSLGSELLSAWTIAVVVLVMFLAAG